MKIAFQGFSESVVCGCCSQCLWLFWKIDVIVICDPNVSAELTPEPSIYYGSVSMCLLSHYVSWDRLMTIIKEVRNCRRLFLCLYRAWRSVKNKVLGPWDVFPGLHTAWPYIPPYKAPVCPSRFSGIHQSFLRFLSISWMFLFCGESRLLAILLGTYKVKILSCFSKHFWSSNFSHLQLSIIKYKPSWMWHLQEIKQVAH